MRSREATEEPQTGWSLTQHVSETHSETRLVSDHPVRAFSERIYFVNGASTPPCQGGECVCPVIGDKHYVGHHTRFTPPAINLGPHVAAIGMRFYTGTMFPPEYRNQIFIAEHGSWNRRVPIGYRVTLVRLEGNKAVKYEPFAEGWLQGSAAWGRPADILVMPDGSLLVSDDRADAIYRVTYSAPR